MPRRTSLRFPSYRNLCIYHELAYERRTQTKVAQTLGLSQRRVSQIGQQVLAWADSLVPPRHYLGQPGMRFHLAIAQERIRLLGAYEPLLGMFTGDDGDPRFLRRYVAVVNGEALNTIEVSEKPDFRLLNQAVNVAGRLAELEAIANRGPLADLPSQVHQTIVHRAAPAPAADDAEAPSNPAPVNRARAASSSNAGECPSNRGDSPSNAASSSSKGPSNAEEKRGSGVLTGSLAAPQTMTHLPVASTAAGQIGPAKNF